MLRPVCRIFKKGTCKQRVKMKNLTYMDLLWMQAVSFIFFLIITLWWKAQQPVGFTLHIQGSKVKGRACVCIHVSWYSLRCIQAIFFYQQIVTPYVCQSTFFPFPPFFLSPILCMLICQQAKLLGVWHSFNQSYTQSQVLNMPMEIRQMLKMYPMFSLFQLTEAIYAKANKCYLLYIGDIQRKKLRSYKNMGLNFS